MLCSTPSCMMVQSIAFLLTETGDAGSSPHVARWVFSIIIIYKLRYSSIDYIKKGTFSYD